MSDRRHRSTPPALPEGYQYGDAREIGYVVVVRIPPGVDLGVYRDRATGAFYWRAPHENAAAQLTRQSISSLRAPVSNAAESAFSDQADKGQQDQDNGEWGGDQAFPALRVHTSGILTQRTGDETV